MTLPLNLAWQMSDCLIQSQTVLDVGVRKLRDAAQLHPHPAGALAMETPEEATLDEAEHDQN